MRLTLRTLARLLGYPSAELGAHVPDLRAALDAEAALPPAARRALDPLLDRLAGAAVLEAQTDYSELFDRSRALSLHLFEHVHGESRERGQAMIDLARHYAEHGLLLSSRELPDYLPIFVEFASCLPPDGARTLLAEPAHVLAALEQRLRARGSDYAAVFGALVALAGARPDRAALDALQRAAPSDDPARIDEEWEERAVSFAGAHDMGGPTGIVARLRATGKAAAAARG
jgi:nitrate reductase delta subunit